MSQKLSIVINPPKHYQVLRSSPEAVDPRAVPDNRWRLSFMTYTQEVVYRASLVAKGLLTPYVYSDADHGFDRPALTVKQVDTLRNRLVASGNLVVAKSTEQVVTDGGEVFYQESKVVAVLYPPRSITFDDYAESECFDV